MSKASQFFLFELFEIRPTQPPISSGCVGQKNKKMAKKILLAIMAIALVASTTVQAQRDTRTHHDETIIMVSGGYTIAKTAEQGFSFSASYDQRMGKSPFFLGMMVQGENLNHTELHSNLTLVGMDVALSYKFQFGAFYLQPRLFGGLSMVSHNTIMRSEFNYLVGSFTQVERQQQFLSPEVGLRMDMGVKFGKFGIGAYASYAKQFASFTPTNATNMTIENEWLTNSPFSAGLVLRWDVDGGITHRGGNNVPLIEPFGAYGNKGFEVGTTVIFQRNDGFHFLASETAGKRGEYIACHHYGLRFGLTDPIGNQRQSVQLGYGLFLTPRGPESVSCWRLMAWAGIGEAATAATTTTNTTIGASGRFGSIQATPKGNLELSYILRPFKDFRRMYAAITAGCAYQYIPQTQVGGSSVLVDQTSEKPFSYYGGISIGVSL